MNLFPLLQRVRYETSPSCHIAHGSPSVLYYRMLNRANVSGHHLVECFSRPSHLSYHSRSFPCVAFPLHAGELLSTLFDQQRSHPLIDYRNHAICSSSPNLPTCSGHYSMLDLPG